jgi:hypothetical protein
MAGQDVVSLAAVLLGMLGSLATLWVRLRFRLCKERERRRYLLAAAALPVGSRVREQREDGTQLNVTVGRRTRMSPR